MSKKNKVRKSGNAVSEEALLKSLNELEEAVLKGGDELLDQDPEGGLSTEGEPLSKKAPKGKGDVAKADDGSEDEGSDEEIGKGGDDDDDGSDEGSEDDGSDEDGGDDESSEQPPPMKGKKGMSKSLRDRADEGETTAKAIEVSDFIESMIDQSSEAFGELQKSVRDGSSTIEDKLTKSEAYQRNFNGRIAQGLLHLGKVLIETNQLVKSLVDQPNPRMRKSILSKAEIQEPMGGDDDDETQQLHPQRVAEWLFQKSLANEIDSLLVTQYEIHRNIEALPVQVRKALVNDLRK